MKKILMLLALVLLLGSVGPGQAQAGTCTCELTFANKIIGFFGLPVSCGDGSAGGEKGQKKESLSDSQVAASYLNQNQAALNDYNKGQVGYDYIKSGWSCLK